MISPTVATVPLLLPGAVHRKQELVEYLDRNANSQPERASREGLSLTKMTI
jgi:hypothetical protein